MASNTWGSALLVKDNIVKSNDNLANWIATTFINLTLLLLVICVG
jgi:hypothetical protein